MKAPKIVNINSYLSEGTPVIAPGNQSPEAQFVPGLVKAYGHFSGFLKVLPVVFPKVVKTILNIKKSYKTLQNNPSNPRRKISRAELQDFEDYARKLGCTDIAYTKVPRDYVFANRVVLFENAIVLTMEMKKRKMNKAPSVITSSEVWRAYAVLGVTVNRLADYLRNQGFSSEAGPALGGETNYPYLAQKAGMGLIGKHGILISKGNGPSQRIAAIYTNIENLSFSDKDQKNWIADFCDSCNICVKVCPTGAIFEDTMTIENGHLRHIDYKKCIIPFSKHAGCSICIKECPFFKGDYEKIEDAYTSLKATKNQPSEHRI